LLSGEERGAVQQSLDFRKLMESVLEADEILKGARAPARETFVDGSAVRELRRKLNLSQHKFAALIEVDVGTVQNWEQGRRSPSGPARALLRALWNDPKRVLKAIHAVD
jgi:putative transcriptional regulator